MKKTQFSAGSDLLKWLKMQSELWGLPRATVIRLVLEHWMETHPDGTRSTPPKKEKAP